MYQLKPKSIHLLLMGGGIDRYACEACLLTTRGRWMKSHWTNSLILIYWFTWGGGGGFWCTIRILIWLKPCIISFFTIVLYWCILASLSVELFDPFIVFEIQSRSAFLIWDIFKLKWWLVWIWDFIYTAKYVFIGFKVTRDVIIKLFDTATNLIYPLGNIMFPIWIQFIPLRFFSWLLFLTMFMKTFYNILSG